MPKMKTRRAAAKRFKLTGRGRIKRNKANHSHMLIRRSNSAKRKMRKTTLGCRNRIKNRNRNQEEYVSH